VSSTLTGRFEKESDVATPKYAVGDVVQLKSGGPKMTIVGVRYYDDPVIFTEYNLIWFDGQGEFDNTRQVNEYIPEPCLRVASYT
jgi:uncharacterized protein YodC (DUF2158 family)